MWQTRQRGSAILKPLSRKRGSLFVGGGKQVFYAAEGIVNCAGCNTGFFANAPSRTGGLAMSSNHLDGGVDQPVPCVFRGNWGYLQNLMGF